MGLSWGRERERQGKKKKTKKQTENGRGNEGGANRERVDVIFVEGIAVVTPSHMVRRGFAGKGEERRAGRVDGGVIRRRRRPFFHKSRRGQGVADWSPVRGGRPHVTGKAPKAPVSSTSLFSKITIIIIFFSVTRLYYLQYYSRLDAFLIFKYR